MGFTIILDNRVQDVRELFGDDGVTVICGQLLRVCVCVGFNSYIYQLPVLYSNRCT